MRSIACAALFFDMRSYKIKSYVPEKTFLSGKDARFCRAAFENCFVVDIYNNERIIAAGSKGELIGQSLAKAFSLSHTASLLNLFNGSNEFLTLPSCEGTLLVYPAWHCLGLALVFHLKECAENVEKAYQNAKRYAFSMLFDSEAETKTNQRLNLELKLCTLEFYISRLFGDKRETNVTAQILMIANLVGCRLHEMSVAGVNATFDEQEIERLGAYLCCVFMTMRRYNGKISTTTETEENAAFLTHAPQEYGIRIQQSVRERVTKFTAFDLPAQSDIEHFATHPAFLSYKIEETDGVLRLHLPIKQRALLSSVATRGRETELTLTLFPLS